MTLTGVLASLLCWSQVGNPHLGARAAALSNAVVSQQDVWSVHHNQAGMAFLEDPEVGISYESRFALRELATKGLVAALPTKFGTFGLNVSQFGYSQYNETKLGVGYARKLAEHVSAGVQLNYLMVSFAEGPYGNRGVLNAELGLQAELTEELTLGAHIFNPTNAKIADYDDERLPVIVRIGADYRFSEKFFTSVEVQKDIDREAQFRVGLEYQVAEIFFLRGGIGTEPFQSSFGFGMLYKDLKLDIATAYHNVLGYSPQASLGYAF